MFGSDENEIKDPENELLTDPKILPDPKKLYNDFFDESFSIACRLMQETYSLLMSKKDIDKIAFKEFDNSHKKMKIKFKDVLPPTLLEDVIQRMNLCAREYYFDTVDDIIDYLENENISSHPRDIFWRASQEMKKIVQEDRNCIYREFYGFLKESGYFKVTKINKKWDADDYNWWKRHL